MLSPKKLEKLAVEKYLKASNQSYKIEDFESPDFILKAKGREIGCEVTEFYPDYTKKGSSLRKRESYLNELHQKIRAQLLEEYPRGYSFSISYKPTVSQRSSIDSEVDLVNLIVKENIESRLVNDPSANIRRIFIRKIGGFPTQIPLMIFSDDVLPKVEWFIPIIEAKTELIKKWNGTYNHKWLVISIGLSRSGDITISRIKDLEKLKSKYWDKIILIDIHFADYVEINAT